MKLKKLEMHGFKSFMDRTEIVFDQGITGIVGPNGSGKSNIGDAVRWVLGEQSPRILRGNRMEDVIFGGTQKRKRASFCEVALTFDNSDGALKSAFSEVCVSRRVYRSGDSEYYLNKTACRLRDIQELFRDTGIGREGYSLIGQGRIDEILSQKSEDRRQVFEEAAGIMTYRVRKEEAERKLSRTGDNLTRVYDILAEIEQRLEPLSREAETAKEYNELFARLRELEINIFLLRYDKLHTRIDTIEKNMEGLRDVLLAHEARLAELGLQREQMDRQLEALEEAIAKAREAHGTQLEALHAQELQKERLSAALAQYEEQHQAHLAEADRLREKKNALAQTEESASVTEASLDAEVQNARIAFQDAQEQALRLAATAAEAERALDQQKSAVLAAVNRQSDVRDRQTRQLTIRAQLEKRVSEIDASLAELDEQKKFLAQQLEADESAQASASSALEESRKIAEDIQKQLDTINQQAQCLVAEAQQANLTLQGHVSRLRVMEEMAKDMAGYQQSVKKALEYAANDSRVHGVLARLISVPRELETPIDMVLGGALQNIVTENEDAAKKVIDYLRANRLGRATFLPISSIRPRTLTQEERRLLSMPGCLGVASELISYPDAYRGIMENLLGRTVIADNLDHGIPIMRAGRHAFRLVTLNGDVMHSGGSMTGGTAQTRTVSLLGREREINDLRQQVKTEKAQLTDLQSRLEDATAEAGRIEASQRSLLDDFHQKEIALTRETEHVSGTRQDLATLSERRERTAEIRQELAANIEEIDRELHSVQSDVDNVALDREQMEKQTEALQNDLTQKRSEAENQRELSVRLQMSLTERVHQLDTFRRDRERNREELRALEQQIVTCGREAESARQNADAVRGQVAAAEADCTVLKEQNATSLSALNELESNRSALNAEQREAVRQSELTHQEIEEDNGKLHRAELNLTKAQNELNAMSEHILTSYDLTYAGAEELRSKEPFDLTRGEQEAGGLRKRIRELGPVNVNAVEQYEAEQKRYQELTTQRDDLLKAKEDLEALIKRLLKQMESIFTGEFDKLGEYFSETFTRLFGGGQAELRLSDPEDPLNCGIDIIAQPPGKKLQLLSLLSGGERALTAIAILFAMLKLKPTPFCILDEIEAALDDSNISNFADYLNEYASTTQFVVVTHRKGTMENCDALYGVAMEERGVSRMVSVNLQDYPN